MSRARNIGRKIASGLKSNALAAAGGGGFAAIEHYLLADADWYNDNWWAGGAMALVLGFIAPAFGDWAASMGHGMAGLGGYLLVKGFLSDEAGAVHRRDAGAVHAPRRMREASGVSWVYDESGNAVPVYA
jgi:hypothetical protein